MLHGIVQQVNGTKSGNIKQLGPFLIRQSRDYMSSFVHPGSKHRYWEQARCLSDWQKIQNFLHRPIRALTNRLRRPTPTHRHRNGASPHNPQNRQAASLGWHSGLGHILGKLHFREISKTGSGGGNRARISGSQSIDSSSVRGACSKWASSSA